MAEIPMAANPSSRSTTPPTSNADPPKQTPITRKTATQPYAVEISDINKTYRNIATETKGHYLVGMKPKTFLDEFLPWNTSTTKSYKQKIPGSRRVNALKSVPPKGSELESVMYARYVSALDKWVTGLPNVATLRFAHFSRADALCGDLNVNMSTYWEKDLPECDTFSVQQTQEEFKPSHRYDAFQHELDEGPNPKQANSQTEEAEEEAKNAGEGGEAGPKGEVNGDAGEEEGTVAEAQSPESHFPQVETDTESGIHTRGQIAAYAGVALSVAFRKHLFSLLILGPYARFIRWDHRGAIVTHRFDYTQCPGLIFAFYLRYGQLTPLQRGLDPMVNMYEGELPETVAQAFEKYYQETWFGGAKFTHVKSSVQHGHPPPPSQDQFFRIQVRDDVLGRTDSFFIPAPRYKKEHMFPFCRASRRSLACLYEDEGDNIKMCFLKDSWQEVSHRSAPEADIYRRLGKASVPYVASMRLGGDVEGLQTETQNWVDKLSHNGRYKRLGKMVCHRIILDTVARALSTFTWCKVLLSCIADAMEGAQLAYKAGVLHRDISAGNIMIVKDKKTNKWSGVLIDWDMCLLWEEAQGEVRTGRTGTWAFISGQILRASRSNPVVHTLWDDMESAFWVLVYEALFYLKHSLESSHLHQLVINLFSPLNETANAKIMAITSFAFLGNGSVTQFEVTGLNKLLVKLARVFVYRYSHDDDDDDELRAPPLYDLNNPDEKWFSNLLRNTAKEMPPLVITPTGLKSPSNDSEPPADINQWEPASIKAVLVDFHLMPWAPHPEHSALVQLRHNVKITSSLLNHLDGLSTNPSKRKHMHEGSDHNTDDPEQLQKKARK